MISEPVKFLRVFKDGRIFARTSCRYSDRCSFRKRDAVGKCYRLEHLAIHSDLQGRVHSLSFFNKAVKFTELIEALFGESVMLGEDFSYFFTERCDILWESGEVEEGLCDLTFERLEITQ